MLSLCSVPLIPQFGACLSCIPHGGQSCSHPGTCLSCFPHRGHSWFPLIELLMMSFPGVSNVRCACFGGPTQGAYIFTLRRRGSPTSAPPDVGGLGYIGKLVSGLFIILRIPNEHSLFACLLSVRHPRKSSRKPLNASPSRSCRVAFSTGSSTEVNGPRSRAT